MSYRDRYRILFELGRGGMGQVFLATASGPGGYQKIVVLKLLRSDVQDREKREALLLEEARLAAQLNHPNIVQIFDAGSSEEGPWLAMEYLDGQPLSRCRSRRPLSLNCELSVAREILAGLGHAHQHRDLQGREGYVIHRDVSPDNVFVTYHGQIKVLDFGLAKVVSPSPEVSPEIAGKLQYMSPEQSRGESLDGRSDLFSLGVLLWEGIAGRSMWGDSSPSGITYRLTNGMIPSLREAAPQTPASVVDLIERTLSPDRDDRYANAREMAVALDACISEIGGSDLRTLGGRVAEAFADTRAAMDQRIETSIAPGRSTPSTKANAASRYAIESRIHDGTTQIFKARQIALDRPVVVRRVVGDWDRQRLRGRLEALAKLSHPNIAGLIDLGHVLKPEPAGLVIREWIDGRSLQDLVTEGPLPPSRATEIGIQILLALEHAHGAGLEHGAIRTRHVMVRSQPGIPDQVKLIDFESRLLGLGKPTLSDIQGALKTYLTALTGVRGDGALQLLSTMHDGWGREAAAVLEGLLHTESPAARVLERLADLPPAPDRLERTDGSTSWTASRSLSFCGRAFAPSFRLNTIQFSTSREPLVWVFPDDPALRNPTAEAALQQIEKHARVMRLAPEQRQLIADRMRHELIELPWVIVFGDLHAMTEQAILRESRVVSEVGHLAISSHENHDLLQETVNRFGLSAHLTLPMSIEEIVACITRQLDRTRTVREMHDQLRREILAEKRRTVTMELARHD